MKKLITLLGSAVLLFCMSACGGIYEGELDQLHQQVNELTARVAVLEGAQAAASEGSGAEYTLTAAEITAELAAKELPLANIIDYTAETDVNALLGRPGQYTSKVNFADSRLKQYNADDPVGGTIEVFGNKADATARKEYVEALNNLAKQYMYQYGNVFIRLDFALTPEQAGEYETILTSIFE